METTYAIYIGLSLVSTIWVGQTLHKNGRVFLVENFAGKETLADSINHLLLVGFYLVNIGFVLLFLRLGDKPRTMVEMIEYLSTKIGVVLFVTGLMHFFNIRALMKLRNSHLFTPRGLTPGELLTRAT